jgi:hypothetical protein
VEERTMKKKLPIAIGAVTMVVIICFITWMSPSNFLKGIKAENIAIISVRDGSTGNNFEIINQEDITFIVERIQSQSFKKDGISLFLMGTMYTMKFLDSNDKLAAEFILNADDTIRKDPFFYKTNPELIGVMQYIKDLSTNDSRK